MLSDFAGLHAWHSDLLFKDNFGHHALILMAQQMAVEERCAPDDRTGEIHHQINISFNGDIHGVQPLWTLEQNAILGIDKEVDLMDVKRVHLVSFVCDLPVMKGTDG